MLNLIAGKSGVSKNSKAVFDALLVVNGVGVCETLSRIAVEVKVNLSVISVFGFNIEKMLDVTHSIY